MINAAKIYRLLKRFNPRCLVCTQALPVSIISSLKRRGKIKLPLVGIVTDMDVHGYWLSREVDLYLVPTDDIKRKMVRDGIQERRILVTGIPIDPHFTTAGHKTAEVVRLGLNPERPTVLVMGGSRGLGPLQEIVATLRRLPEAPQVLAVCGDNGRTRLHLQRRFENDRSVKVFGFTRNLSRLMDAADVLVSKPGGMTCAESTAKGLPFVMIHPIPGQEERNARFLLRHGAAERAETMQELSLTVRQLLQDPLRRERLRQRALSLSKPRAAHDAAQAILELLKEPAMVPSFGVEPALV